MALDRQSISRVGSVFIPGGTEAEAKTEALEHPNVKVEWANVGDDGIVDGINVYLCIVVAGAKKLTKITEDGTISDVTP